MFTKVGLSEVSWYLVTQNIPNKLKFIFSAITIACCNCRRYEIYVLVLLVSTELRPGPEVLKTIPCSTQPGMNFFLPINVKMSTIVGILTFMSRKYSNIDSSKPEKS